MALLTPAEIKRIASKRGLTMRAVCARASIAPSTWARWQAGRTRPTLAVYERIVEAIFADDDEAEVMRCEESGSD